MKQPTLLTWREDLKQYLIEKYPKNHVEIYTHVSEFVDSLIENVFIKIEKSYTQLVDGVNGKKLDD